MIGNMFGSDHPAICMYNGTSLAEKEQYKVTMQQIVDKNLEIAEAAYGAESIHLLY
jgi:hypothetical protein